MSSKDVTCQNGNDKIGYYHMLFEIANDAIFVETFDGQIIDVNSAACTLLGYSREELLAMNVASLLQPEEQMLISELFQSGVAIEGKSFVGHNIRKGGKLVPVDVRANVFEQNGEQYLLVSVRDVTERIETLEKVRRQNECLISLHETSIGLLNFLEVEGLLKNILARACELLGTPNGDIILMDESRGVLEVKVSLGYNAYYVGHVIHLGEGLAGKVAESGQPLIIEDYFKWPGRIIDPTWDDLQTAVAIPLKSGQKVIGVISIDFFGQQHYFSKEEMHLFNLFAELASIALDNASLHAAHDESEKQLQQNNEELQNINQELEEEIVERAQAEEALRQKEEALRTSKEAISMAAELAQLGPWEYEPETNLFKFSDEFNALYGTNVEQEGCFMAADVYFREFVHPEDARIVKTGIASMLSPMDSHPCQFEHRIIRRDGEVRTIVVRINVIRDEGGKIIRSYGANQDITERVRAEEALRQQSETIRHMAYFDQLTGLANRVQLNELLNKELESARKGDSSGCILFLDLDDLKMVNDTYGHTCGDDIIIEAGTRIVAEVGKDAFVARIGGDEFIIVLTGKSDRQAIEDIAKRIIESLGQKHEVLGTNFHMTASIGIAAYPADGDTTEEIIKNADNAMYAAKRDGKNCWRFYSAVMQIEAYEKMRLTNSLRYAQGRGEFTLHYQPQMLTEGRKVAGFEALIRWNSSEHGSVPPVQFIPLAEQCGLIHPIGRWVIEEACKFAKRLDEQGWGTIPVAVNISPKQLAADDFIAIVRNAVNEAGIEPHQLELEITESILIESLEDANRKLTELREFGVGLSLDDFGTGYSSLTYLRNLPVGTLKIDKPFIDMITTDSNVPKIICSIINIAHILNMTVIAEGVETEEQLAYLAANGCDRIQGYIYSRPIPEAEAIKFLAAHG